LSQPDLRPDPPEMRPREPGPALGCVAGALITIGLLILVPSGLCTAILGLSAITGLIKGGWTLAGDWGVGGTLSVIAAALVGYVLVRIGRKLRGET